MKGATPTYVSLRLGTRDPTTAAAPELPTCCLPQCASATLPLQPQLPPPPYYHPLNISPWKNVKYVKGERHVLKAMKKVDEGGVEELSTTDSSEETIAILGDRWRPQAAKKDGDKIS